MNQPTGPVASCWAELLPPRLRARAAQLFALDATAGSKPPPGRFPSLASPTSPPAAGLTHPIDLRRSDHATYILENIGGGCAFFDYDNDGWMDIFLTQRPPRSTDVPPGSTNRLYKNNRNGTFTDVTEKAGLISAGWAIGVCVGDYNNDGFEDLFVTYYGQNRLYRNNGDGTFTDVTEKAGLLQPGTPLRLRMHFRRLQPRRPARPLRLQLRRHRSRHRSETLARHARLRLRGSSRRLRPARTPHSAPLSLSQQRRRHIHRRLQRIRHRSHRRLLRPHRRQPSTPTKTAGPTSSSPATPRPACCS